jgi:hypothetical protein
MMVVKRMLAKNDIPAAATWLLVSTLKNIVTERVRVKNIKTKRHSQIKLIMLNGPRSDRV